MSSARQAGAGRTAGPAPAPMGRRERKKHELRERIVDAATALITQQGLSNTTIDQIAEACDIAQATFFNHFGSKGVLLDAVVGRLTGAFNEILEGMDTLAASRIELMFSITATLTPSEQRMVREVLVESARTWSAGTLEAISHTRDLHIADIAAAQERGDIRSDRTAADLADAAIGLYFSVLLFWDPNGPDSLSARLEGTRALVADLLAGPTGPPPINGRESG
jgi:AcrR family transcriptional regulator